MAAAPGPSVETKVDHRIAAEVSANMDSPELEDWFDAKHRFQVAAYRLLVQTMHKPEADPAAGVTDAALYAEHAGASIAIVAATLRLLTNDDGSLKTSGYIPLKSPVIDPRLAHAHCLTLRMNEELLELQSDAIGIMRSYIRAEREGLEEKYAAFM